MVLSTGEKGLADKIAEEGSKVQVGQAVRLIDVPADAGKGLGIFENLHSHESPSAFADCIKKAAAQNYGHAARAFITQLQQRRQQTLEKLMRTLRRYNLARPVGRLSGLDSRIEVFPTVLLALPDADLADAAAESARTRTELGLYERPEGADTEAGEVEA